MKNDGTPLSDLSAPIQRGLNRIAVVADYAHSLGASRVVSHMGQEKIEQERRYCGRIADFSSFSFHTVKNYTTAEGGASTWCLPQSVYDEGVSLLENAGHLGLPIPEKLKSVLEQLHDRAEKEGDE